MDDLARRAYVKLARFQITLVVLIFLPAWTLRYWQGWLVWTLFAVCCVAMTQYFLTRDPALIARRMASGPVAEREPRQKLIQTFSSVLVVAIFLVSALDYGRGWSSVPLAAVPIGAALIVLGFAVMFQAFRDNSFAASIIQVDRGQKVIDTDLYARVRHPMYSGALLMFAGIPLALASWWGLVPVVLLAAAIVWRLTDEERFLARNLAGYEAYRGRVSARLIPGVW